MPQPAYVFYDPSKWDHGEQAGIYISESQNSDVTEAPPMSQGSTAQGRRMRTEGSGTGAWNTSITYTETSAQTFGFDPKDAENRNKRLGEEMRSRTVGPMPVDEFLDTFLAARDISFADMPSPKGAFSAVLQKKPAPEGEGGQKPRKLKESDIYRPLIEALNASADAARGSRCPGFTFRDTSDHPDESFGSVGAKKPDICCYADRHLGKVVADSASKDPLKSRTDMGLAATFFEIKLHESSDLFLDPPPGASVDVRSTWPFVFGEHDGKTLLKLQEILGQNSSYSAEVFMRQYRRYLYSVTMAGTRARLVRWDRAGAIVSEGFDIRAHPEHLCRFFWCFSRAPSDSERGYDITVEPALEKEEQLFKTLIKQHIAAQLPLASRAERRSVLAEHYAPSCVTSIYVPREVEGYIYSYEYLVSRPIVVPLSIAGRSTRGYWAVDAQTEEVVFLKDTWRSGVREAEHMLAMQESNVANVPPVAYHSDVPNVEIEHDEFGNVLYLVHGRPQTTLTQDHIRQAWVCGDREALRTKVHRRTHYRLILGYAGFPLTKFEGTSELLHGVHDAFIALRSAYDICGRLHRDITPGNIILYRDVTCDVTAPRKGFLIDWEWSCDKKSASSAHKRHDASMSWQFLSLACATRKFQRYEIQDDMESLYYVVLYCALLYLPHGHSGSKLLEVLGCMFDWGNDSKTDLKAGAGKCADFTTRQFTRDIVWGSPGLQEWMNTVYEDLADHVIQSFKKPGYVGNWSLSAFASVWDKFFASKAGSSLSSSDRIEHVKLPQNIVLFSSSAPRGATGMLNQATVACEPAVSSTPRPTSSNPEPHASSTSVSRDSLNLAEWFRPEFLPSEPDPSDPSSSGMAGTSTAGLSGGLGDLSFGCSGPIGVIPPAVEDITSRADASIDAPVYSNLFDASVVPGHDAASTFIQFQGEVPKRKATSEAEDERRTKARKANPDLESF